MNALNVVAISIVAVWLGLVTILIVLCVRQIAIVMQQVQELGDAENTRRVDAQPEPAPAELVEEFEGATEGEVLVLFLSSACTVCSHLAAGLRTRENGPPLIVVVLQGSGRSADRLAGELPAGTHVIRDPKATAISHAVGVHATPLAIAVNAGAIVARRTPRSIAHLESMSRQRTNSHNVTFAHGLHARERGTQDAG